MEGVYHMFYDYVNQLRDAASAIEGADLTVYDNLTSSYQTLEETSAAKVAEMEQTIMALNAEISKLKATNYDLMMSAGAPAIGDDDQSDESELEDEGIDSLFDDDNDNDN